jgi:hypothetical protein
LTVSARALGGLALLVAVGTVATFVVSLSLLFVPLPPALYLGALGLAVGLAAIAAWRSRGWLTVSALAVSMLLLVLAGLFHFVAMRVPPGRPLVAVGQPAPEFTLPDAAGRSVSLSDYRDRKPVVLVFYRGYW